jgi:hypothetical protein
VPPEQVHDRQGITFNDGYEPFPESGREQQFGVEVDRVQCGFSDRIAGGGVKAYFSHEPVARGHFLVEIGVQFGERPDHLATDEAASLQRHDQAVEMWGTLVTVHDRRHDRGTVSAFEPGDHLKEVHPVIEAKVGWYGRDDLDGAYGVDPGLTDRAIGVHAARFRFFQQLALQGHDTLGGRRPSKDIVRSRTGTIHVRWAALFFGVIAQVVLAGGIQVAKRLHLGHGQHMVGRRVIEGLSHVSPLSSSAALRQDGCRAR